MTEEILTVNELITELKKLPKDGVITVDNIAEYIYRGDKEIFDDCVERVKKRGYNQQQAKSLVMICLQILSHNKMGDVE